MKKLFKFGETVKGYDIPVLNEREARGAAGILLFAALIVFMNALLLRNFTPLKIFITYFLIDFSLRMINPNFSPSLILARILVSNQTVEYTGAAQKRFAWALGLMLSSFMFVWVVILENVGLINLAVCSICLLLLFMESAFSICLGCKLYNLTHKEKAKLCPGGVCQVKIKEPVQKVSIYQYSLLVVSIIIIIFNFVY